jgi:hypothetical protein
MDLKEEDSTTSLSHLTTIGVRRENVNEIRRILGMPEIDEHCPKVSTDKERKAWEKKRELDNI